MHRERIDSDEAETRARMNLAQEVDDFIKDTIDLSLGLPISMEALHKKLYTAEESQRRLRNQYLTLLSRLKEKDDVIDRVRSEASMNAQALKKFVEENQKLATECVNLLSQCKNLEKECVLYHQDRDALMEFGNESDERAREAEARVRELEEAIRRMSEEMQIYKRQIVEVDSYTTPLEEDLLDSVLGSLISKDETIMGRLFLEANVHDQSCQTLLGKWDHLKPSTQKVLALVSRAKKFEKEKECIILNLAKAEQEVELVTKLNRKLDKENRKLLRQQSPLCSTDRNQNSQNSAPVMSNKRKSPKMMTSPSDKRLEFSSPEVSRKPLSPMWNNNSPDSRMNNK